MGRTGPGRQGSLSLGDWSGLWTGPRPPVLASQRRIVCGSGVEGETADSGGAGAGEAVRGEGEPMNDGADAESVPETEEDVAMCEKLLRVFQENDRGRWKMLITHSSRWAAVRGMLYGHIRGVAEGANAHDKVALLGMIRRLKETSAAVDRRDAILDKFLAVEEEQGRDAGAAVVAGHRPELDQAWFEHIKVRASQREAVEEYHSLSLRVLSMMEQHDAAEANEEGAARASRELENILQSESLAEAEAKIEALGSGGKKIDESMMLAFAKAYSSAAMQPKAEVKEMMGYMYQKFLDTCARQLPPEVRILKYVISIDDKERRLMALEEAFTPAAALELITTEGQEDVLFTTPERLLAVINSVLDAYERRLASNPMIQGSKEFMKNPFAIERLRLVREEIQLAGGENLTRRY